MTCSSCGTELEFAEVPTSTPVVVAGVYVDRDDTDYLPYCPNQECLPVTEAEEDFIPF